MPCQRLILTVYGKIIPQFDVNVKLSYRERCLVSKLFKYSTHQDQTKIYHAWMLLLHLWLWLSPNSGLCAWHFFFFPFVS